MKASDILETNGAIETHCEKLVLSEEFDQWRFATIMFPTCNLGLGIPYVVRFGTWRQESGDKYPADCSEPTGYGGQNLGGRY